MTGTLEARTVTVTIERSPADVYAFVADVRNLPRWSFFASVTRSGDRWLVGTPNGQVELRLAEPNALGVLDHEVVLDSGRRVLVPMRVVRNGDGSEVLFTVLRQPGMSDEAFAADIGQVERDLATLKSVLEGER